MAVKDVELDRAEVPQAELSRNKHAIKAFFEKQQAQLDVIKTTTTPSGRTIDWIPIGSQGEIATPPPFVPTLPAATLGLKGDSRQAQDAAPVFEAEGAERGPEGTVPVLRYSVANVTGEKTLAQHLSKKLPPHPDGNKHLLATATDTELPTPDPYQHHWAGAYQDVKHYGCNGTYSCFDPAVEANDSESLIQTGILNQNATRSLQTIEVGWQVLPSLYGDKQPHLFTFFRTDNETVGDYKGGYNQTVKGWVQVDATIHPGSTFTPFSAVGDTTKQFQVNVAVQLYAGNWWVWAQGKWIGYYPASLFQAAALGSPDTLASYANRLGFWGEIADSPGIKTATVTDMGSGQFPEKGFGWSAYMNKLTYSDSTSGTTAQYYDGSKIVFAADPTWYRIVPHFTPIDANWGSYEFVGGPGAG
jgi:Neprosin